MFTSEPKELTDVSRVFLEPTNATHRQYEALRAFFIDGIRGVEVARRFGYTPGSFRVLAHQFRQNPVAPSSSHLPRDPSPHPNPIPSATSSSPSANKTSRSTISAVIWLTKVTASVQLPSPRSSRTKASLAYHAGPMTNVHQARGRPRPMSPMSGNST
jgi:hypothetical protein